MPYYCQEARIQYLGNDHLTIAKSQALDFVLKCLATVCDKSALQPETDTAYNLLSLVMMAKSLTWADVKSHVYQTGGGRIPYDGKVAASSVVVKRYGDNKKDQFTHVTLQSWVCGLATIMQSFFDCRVYATTLYNETEFVFYGAMQNTTTATLAFRKLHEQVQEQGKFYRGKGFDSYALGFVAGLDDAMVDNETAHHSKTLVPEDHLQSGLDFPETPAETSSTLSSSTIASGIIENCGIIHQGRAYIVRDGDASEEITKSVDPFSSTTQQETPAETTSNSCLRVMSWLTHLITTPSRSFTSIQAPIKVDPKATSITNATQVNNTPQPKQTDASPDLNTAKSNQGNGAVQTTNTSPQMSAKTLRQLLFDEYETRPLTIFVRARERNANEINLCNDVRDEIDQWQQKYKTRTAPIRDHDIFEIGWKAGARVELDRYGARDPKRRRLE